MILRFILTLSSETELAMIE